MSTQPYPLAPAERNPQQIVNAIRALQTQMQTLSSTVTTNETSAAHTVKGNIGGSSGTMGDLTPVQVAGSFTAGGYVNKFRNGMMDIAQRGTSGLAVGGYTLDGWLIFTAGASPTVSQQYDANLSSNALRIPCAVGMTVCNLQQRIESSIAAQLLANNKTAQPVTVQFTIYNNTGASITPQITTQYMNARDNVSAVTTDLATVNFQSIANGAIATVAYTFMPSVSSVNGYIVALGFGAQLNAGSGFVDISYADIRATPGLPTGLNNNPPPPEMRPIATELAYCQRYFQAYSPPGLVGVAPASSATVARMSMALPVVMRAAPSLVLVSALPVYNGAQTTTMTSVTINECTSGIFQIDGATAAAWGAGANNPCVVYTGAGGSITLSAEL